MSRRIVITSLRRPLLGCQRSKRNYSSAGAIICLGGLTYNCTSKSSYCLAEAAPSRPKRRRPPIFGSTIPKITTRGMVTNNNATAADISDRDNCPMCKKFGSGPCGELFKLWLACTDKHPGKDASGEPLHLNKCSDFAENLAECLDANSEYYDDRNESDKKGEDANASERDERLKNEWSNFVNEMEDGIASGKYNVLPFPEKMNPKVEVRLDTSVGAAFFVSENDGQPLVAAYIMDDSGGVIAAGSIKDMDMGSLGCVLQFNVSKGMRSATARAIYDREVDDVVIFTRTTLLPDEDK